MKSVSSTSRLKPSTLRVLSGLSALALLLGICAPAAVADPTAPKIFVSSTGSDTNSGAQTAPKKTFASAIAAVASGGEIVALDTYNYGGVTITKPVTITAPQGIIGFITAPNSTDGIDIKAGSQDIITLRNLSIENTTGTGNTGINGVSYGLLRVENCTVTGFTNGININSTSGTATVIDGAHIYKVQTGFSVTSNTSGITANAVVSHCEFDSNGSVAINAFAPLNGAVVNVTVSKCLISASVVGVASAGTGSTANVSECTISDCFNPTTASASGQVITFGNNTLANNPNPPQFTSQLPLE